MPSISRRPTHARAATIDSSAPGIDSVAPSLQVEALDLVVTQLHCRIELCPCSVRVPVSNQQLGANGWQAVVGREKLVEPVQQRKRCLRAPQLGDRNRAGKTYDGGIGVRLELLVVGDDPVPACVGCISGAGVLGGDARLEYVLQRLAAGGVERLGRQELSASVISSTRHRDRS